MSRIPFTRPTVANRWSTESSRTASSLNPAQSGFSLLLLCACVFSLLLIPAEVMAGAAIPEWDGKVGRIVDRHAGGDMAKLWRGASELENLGDDAIGEIQGLLAHENTGSS